MRFHPMKAAVFCAALALAGAANADVMSASDSTYANVDWSTVTRNLVINSHGSVSDVNLTVDFSKCDDPAIGPNGTECTGWGDGNASEISIYLTSPTGQLVTLVAAGTYGDTESGRVLVTFDDQAAQSVGPVLTSGTFRPVDPLSSFNGMDMYGTWTLTLGDNFPGDPFEYFSSLLSINGGGGDGGGGGEPPPADVPEPASAAIVALGLAGLAGARRRRKHGA